MFLQFKFITVVAFIVQVYFGQCYISPSSVGDSSSSSIPGNDHYVPDVFFRELMERLNKDFMEPLEFMSSRGSKTLEQLDYDSLLDGNPNPSIRDQEYLQHSSLWGHQYVSGGGGELPSSPGKPEIKTDAGLPAYCDPPNPCPVGYTTEHGCLEEFENTAAFSREYQAAQDCICDGEHMFECHQQIQEDDQEPVNDEDTENNENSDLESYLAQQYHTGASTANNQKNLISKKIPLSLELNPFLQGDKLPIAAKKGIKVY